MKKKGLPGGEAPEIRDQPETTAGTEEKLESEVLRTKKNTN